MLQRATQYTMVVGALPCARYLRFEEPIQEQQTAYYSLRLCIWIPRALESFFGILMLEIYISFWIEGKREMNITRFTLRANLTFETSIYRGCECVNLKVSFGSLERTVRVCRVFYFWGVIYIDFSEAQ